jgi:hypothetical protein
MWSSVMVTVIVAAMWTSVDLRSQAAGAQSTPAKAANWTPPRTPWGDPDLQGNYTNTYEQGTPLERPDQFAGRKLEDIKGEELAKLRQAIEARTIGGFQGPIHAPDHWWQDNLNLTRGSQAWMVIDPPDGKVPPMTAEARQRIAAAQASRKSSGRGPADSYTDRSLYDRCITRGYPSSGMPSIYGNSSEIVQGPGFVAFRYEMIHETRVIPLDGSVTPVGNRIGQDMGSARGYWEGDTLVVESSGFKGRSVYRNANPETLKLTERYTRISPTQVRWTITVNDPSTWTKPWTYTLPLTVDNVPLPSYECHEGNYGLPNILSAARAEERDAAREGRAPRREFGPENENAQPAEGR